MIKFLADNTCYQLPYHWGTKCGEMLSLFFNKMSVIKFLAKNKNLRLSPSSLRARVRPECLEWQNSQVWQRFYRVPSGWPKGTKFRISVRMNKFVTNAALNEWLSCRNYEKKYCLKINNTYIFKYYKTVFESSCQGILWKVKTASDIGAKVYTTSIFSKTSLKNECFSKK